MMNASTVRVLLVEDDADEARLVRASLSTDAASRFAVHHEIRLSAAEVALRQETFDVILLDLSLPDSHGLETLKCVEALALDTPVVVMTGLDDGETAIKAIRSGAQDYLPKTELSPSLLRRSIHYAIDRYATQSELRAAHAGLEQRVRQRTAELAAANEQLQREIAVRRRTELDLQEAKEAAESANRAKSEFLTTMSHELRTPLNGLIGMTDLLLSTELSSQQRRYAWLAKSSGDALLALINNVLDFSKIEAGKLELEETVFELPCAVENVVGILASNAIEKGLVLTSGVAPTVPTVVRGDPGRLQQILINLIGNAIKFTGRGQVAVQVDVEVERDTWTIIRFTIADTGIGIPADRQDRLFLSFSQVDASTTRAYGGTGLGLAICKRLVESMGGDIGVRSDEGEGATFWFTVRFEKHDGPITPHRPTIIDGEPEQNFPVHARPHANASHAGAGQRILIADDHEISQEVAATVLRQAGYDCEVVSNGREAVEALCARSFDLVLMDCQMPEMDGFQAARAIRQREASQANGETGEGKTAPGGTLARVPIIALTANAIKGDKQRCLEAGMDDYISKPLDPKHLLDAIAAQLSRSGSSERSLPAYAE